MKKAFFPNSTSGEVCVLLCKVGNSGNLGVKFIEIEINSRQEKKKVGRLLRMQVWEGFSTWLFSRFPPIFHAHTTRFRLLFPPFATVESLQSLGAAQVPWKLIREMESAEKREGGTDFFPSRPKMGDHIFLFVHSSWPWFTEGLLSQRMISLSSPTQKYMKEVAGDLTNWTRVKHFSRFPGKNWNAKMQREKKKNDNDVPMQISTPRIVQMHTPDSQWVLCF